MSAACASGEARALRKASSSASMRARDFVLVAAEKFSRRHQGGARLGRELRRFFPRCRDQGVFCRDRIDQASGLSLVGPKTFAGEKPGAGAGHADPARQQQRGAGLGQEAEIDERQREARFGRRIDEIAMEQHGATDSDRQPVDSSDQRLGKGGDLAHEIGAGHFPALNRGDEIADVVAGGKDAARAGHQNRADRRVALGFVQGHVQRPIHGVGQGVLLGRAVQRQLQHSARSCDFDIRHSRLPQVASCIVLDRRARQCHVRPHACRQANSLYMN